MNASNDTEREIAERLRLRGDPGPVARLSRRKIAVLAGLAAATLGAVTGWSLTKHRRTVPSPAPSSEATSAAAPPVALASLPKDYAGAPADAPKLGPPLPGDLGRPLLQARAAAPSSSRPGEVPANPAASAAEAEAAQARTSRLAAPLSARGPSSAPETERTGSAAAATAGDARSARQDGTEAKPGPAPSSFVLQAGAVIPAALVTGVRADLPGEVVAQVTQDVFDSASGRWKLIPQGARLLGSYDSRVTFGQSRVQLVWTRLLLPNGRAIDLEKSPATDVEGEAGLEDEVDRHWRRFAGAALISTLLGVGSELGAGQGEGALVQALRNGLAASSNQAGQLVVGKSLETPPTLVVRPGFPVRVLVAKDLTLEPWTS